TEKNMNGHTYKAAAIDELKGLYNESSTRTLHFADIANNDGMSDEHAIISNRQFRDQVEIGGRVEVIMNHICPVSNLYEKAFPVENKEVLEEIEVGHGGSYNRLSKRKLVTMEIITIIILTATLIAVSIIIQMMRVKKKPKVKITVKNEKIITDDFDDEKLYRFTILNESDQSVVIDSIQMYSEGSEIFDNGHHPGFRAPGKEGGDVVDIDSKRVRDISGLLSSNFLGTTVVQSDEEMAYSYYLNASPDELRL